MELIKTDLVSDLMKIIATLAVAIGITIHYIGAASPIWIVIPMLYCYPVKKLFMMLYIICSKQKTSTT